MQVIHTYVPTSAAEDEEIEKLNDDITLAQKQR